MSAPDPPPVRPTASSLRSLHPRRIAAALWLAALAGAVLLPASLEAQPPAPLTAGTNVNLVGGPARLETSPTFRIVGDPYLQRQNEPSLACSSRNPRTCLAAGNDYRLVETPGVKDGRVTGDAWLGVFWTRDEGMTWRSTLLPGFPQDNSREGLASPVRGRGAAADPTVRAGTNGLFYVSGIAFDRSGESTTNGGKTGAMFVSVYIDDNNTENADTPIRYVRTVVVDSGTSGQFLDKPWLAVDVPRGGATCEVPSGLGVPAQTIPAGIAYVAYSSFQGSGNNQHSKLLFTRSTDCGRTWANPSMLDEGVEVSQSAYIAIDPRNGDLVVTWRQFGDDKLSDPGRIRWARSTDFGKSFTKSAVIRDLGLPATTKGFDQPTLPTAEEPDVRMFRTNGFPTACIDSTGLHRVAWSERGIQQPEGDARVVVSTWRPGDAEWSTPVPVDNHSGRGHQFMPSIACTGDRATLAWYDQRWDEADLLDQALKDAIFGGSVFGPWIMDPKPFGAHTVDVRAAQTTPGGSGFNPSISVSRYQHALLADGSAVKLESNPVNWPLYAGGEVPFLGDYIDLAPARPFVPPSGDLGWRFNTDTTESPVLHAAWADNRDIPKPPSFTDYDWANWAAAGTAGCSADVPTSTRNQNIYTARLSSGLVVSAPANSRVVPEDPAGRRAYPLFVQNGTAQLRRFLITVPAGGPASFGTGTPAQTTLRAEVPPFSGIARTVFVVPPPVAVVVKVNETDGSGQVLANGLYGTAVINGDPASPPPLDPSVLGGVEVYTPDITGAYIQVYTNPDVGSLSYDASVVNPTFINPTFINPTFINPTFINQTYTNPTFINPTFINPTFINPTFINPTFINPTFINPTFINQPVATDITWAVTNSGNVATGYNFSALLASVPEGVKAQLIVSRLHSAPTSQGCQQGVQYYTDVLAVIDAPELQSPAEGGNPDAAAANATFALAAGDTAVVTLRASYPAGVTFDADTISALVVSQPDPTARDASDKAAPVVTLPGSIEAVEATGPTGAVVTFAPATAVDVVDGPLAAAGCTPESGSTFALGTTTVTCAATDAAGNTGSGSFTITVVDTTAPAIAPSANLFIEATSPAGATVNYTNPVTSDLVDGAGTATCAPASGSPFPLGTTTVGCAAQDAAGNTSSSSFTVTVRDTTGPAVVEVATPATLLWSPNKTMTPVTVSGSVIDSFPIAAVSYRVVDEYGYVQPAGPVTLGAGGVFAFVVRLEAWRQGTDRNGRVYTVLLTAVDVNNNSTTASTIVLVPHSSK